MGQLEYQAMPSLRDVAHDGVLCTFSKASAAGNSVSSQLGSSCQGNQDGTEKARPSRTKSHLPDHSSPASHADCHVGLAHR
jgi:hypothetical protein